MERGSKMIKLTRSSWRLLKVIQAERPPYPGWGVQKAPRQIPLTQLLVEAVRVFYLHERQAQPPVPARKYRAG
jgi:hypothetical protein